MEQQEQLLILEEYKKIEGLLHDISKDFIDEYLYEIDKAGIHSYRYRTKDPEHLLEKIERKQRENPRKFAGLDHTNFHKFITDLIGIRVFFLYREDLKKFMKALEQAVDFIDKHQPLCDEGEAEEEQAVQREANDEIKIDIDF